MQALNPLVRAEAVEERSYQFDISKEAAKRNTLVVLPTALGKTVIAAMVASHFLYNYRDSKVLVMAPTRPLVLQHRDTFMRLLKLRPQDVQVLTGKYDPNYRLNVWHSSSRIYFATPQVVRNDHEIGMSLKDFGLLVFDECHRARKNYAYTHVARAYVNEAPYPIILGLTASPGSDKERIKEICDALYIEHVEARTEDDPDVKPYINPVKIDWEFVRLPESYVTVKEILRRMLDARLRRLSLTGVIRKDPRYIFRTDLLKAGDEIRYRIETTSLEEERGQLYGLLVQQSSSLTLFHALELLESQGPQTLKCFLNRIRESKRTSHKKVVSELIATGVYNMLDSGSLEDHPKLSILEGIVLGQLSSSPSSRIIVFTQYRDTSHYLASRLSKLGVPADRFIGQTDRGWESGLTQEQQSLLLEKFREGKLKVLVATSIGEEGLDIPSVELVIFYEPVPSEIRYIQRKGRTGRRRFGRVVILAAEDSLDMNYLAASRKMADRMKHIVKGLNKELNPIIRIGPIPNKNPIPVETIHETEKLLQPIPEMPMHEKGEPEAEILEDKRLRSFNREVRAVAKRVLFLVLRSGGEGIKYGDLTTEFEEVGIGTGVIRAAIEKLSSENQVKVSGVRILPQGAVAGSVAKESHVFEVERVLLGEAILLVDEKWRAALLPNDYGGPRNLIRKGSRFKAIAELYKLDGKLHVRIHAIEVASV